MVVSVVANKTPFFNGFRRWIFGGFCRRRRIQHFRTSRAVIVVFVGAFGTGFRRCFYGFRRGRKTLFNGFRRWVFYGCRRGKERFLMVSVVGCFMVSGCYRTAAFSPMETDKKTSGRFRDNLSVYIYIYIYTHACILLIILLILYT